VAPFCTSTIRRLLTSSIDQSDWRAKRELHVENALETTLERPLDRVTLYTAGSQRGTGLAARTELTRLGEPIEGAELDALLSVLQ
jgi:hypothetical protein